MKVNDLFFFFWSSTQTELAFLSSKNPGSATVEYQVEMKDVRYSYSEV